MDISHVMVFFAGFLGKIVGSWFVHIFKDSILPYFYKYTSPQISLNGEWVLKHIGDAIDGEGFRANWSVRMTLNLKGNKIAGESQATCVKGPKELKDKVISYEVSGSYINNILNLHMVDRSESGLRNQSTMMLQLVGDGSVFEGYRIFLGKAKNQIRTIRCELIKNGACVHCGTA